MMWRRECYLMDDDVAQEMVGTVIVWEHRKTVLPAFLVFGGIIFPFPLNLKPVSFTIGVGGRASRFPKCNCRCLGSSI